MAPPSPPPSPPRKAIEKLSGKMLSTSDILTTQTHFPHALSDTMRATGHKREGSASTISEEDYDQIIPSQDTLVIRRRRMPLDKREESQLRTKSPKGMLEDQNMLNGEWSQDRELQEVLRKGLQKVDMIMRNNYKSAQDHCMLK